MNNNVKQYIDTYFAHYQHYQTYWNYEDGCVLMGARQMFAATGDTKYAELIIRYLDPLIDPDGTITNYETGKHNIDGFNCGKVLFFAYDYTKEEKYKLAIDFLMKNLRQQPRTKAGNFWHKAIYPHQVWLDGLYMAQPFYMEYETRFNKKEQYNDIVSQFQNVRKLMFDEQAKLYYHGYDETRQMFWADAETGLSANFWLRSMGWLLMALIDTIDVMSNEIYEHYRALCDLFKEAVSGILAYQDTETQLFYQVIDYTNHPEITNNYTETSGSSMVAYAILKGVRIGVLNEEKYKPIGIAIMQHLIAEKLIDKQLIDICKVAGLGPDTSPQRDGSVAYYLSEPKTKDDAKGVGPFIMAYAQYSKAT